MSEIIHYEPQNEETKRDWMAIYEDYKFTGDTLKAVADRHGVSYSHVLKIKKWCDKQYYDKGDSSYFKNLTVTRVEKNVDKIEALLNRINTELSEEHPTGQTDANGNAVMAKINLATDKNAVKNITTLLSELRKTHETIGNVMGVLKAVEKNTAPSVHIHTPQLQRGRGVENAVVVNE